ncbi:hypothetical protein Tco_0536589 [Tanacetum coccineum]
MHMSRYVYDCMKPDRLFIYLVDFEENVNNTKSTEDNTRHQTAPTHCHEAQLQSLNDQGVADCLANADASRSRDGDNSHCSGTGGALKEFIGLTQNGRKRWQSVFLSATVLLQIRMITDKYLPQVARIKKLNAEYWNLNVESKVERVTMKKAEEDKSKAVATLKKVPIVQDFSCGIPRRLAGYSTTAKWNFNSIRYWCCAK